MQSIAEIKSTILEYVASTNDESVLADIQTFVLDRLKKQKSSVTYNSKGEPFTISEYQADLEEARIQYSKNQFFTQEELEKRL